MLVIIIKWFSNTDNLCWFSENTIHKIFLLINSPPRIFTSICNLLLSSIIYYDLLLSNVNSLCTPRYCKYTSLCTRFWYISVLKLPISPPNFPYIRQTTLSLLKSPYLRRTPPISAKLPCLQRWKSATCQEILTTTLSTERCCTSRVCAPTTWPRPPEI